MQKNIFLMKFLKVRPLQKKDSGKLWEIRDYEQVRKQSLHPDPISLQEHQRWFHAYIANKKNTCFVLTYKQEVIGYTRFDSKDRFYIISIALTPSYHGLGLGDFLLSQSLKKIKRLRDTKIIATIRKNNIPSLSLFTKYHFVKYREDGEYIYLEYEPTCA